MSPKKCGPKFKGGGGKALVAGPLKKDFCGFPYISTIVHQMYLFKVTQQKHTFIILYKMFVFRSLKLDLYLNMNIHGINGTRHMIYAFEIKYLIRLLQGI